MFPEKLTPLQAVRYAYHIFEVLPNHRLIIDNDPYSTHLFLDSLHTTWRDYAPKISLYNGVEDKRIVVTRDLRAPDRTPRWATANTRNRPPTPAFTIDEAATLREVYDRAGIQILEETATEGRQLGTNQLTANQQQTAPPQTLDTRQANTAVYGEQFWWQALNQEQEMERQRQREAEAEAAIRVVQY